MGNGSPLFRNVSSALGMNLVPREYSGLDVGVSCLGRREEEGVVGWAGTRAGLDLGVNAFKYSTGT